MVKENSFFKIIGWYMQKKSKQKNLTNLRLWDFEKGVMEMELAN